MSTVSVVIPCYNYGRYLRECMNSVLGQRGINLRVLVIDDASTDDSAKVAGDFAARDRRVEVIRHKKNRGHLTTYNEGLDWAEGDLLLLLSADDLLTQRSLARSLKLFDDHPDVVMVHGRQVAVHPDEQPLLPRQIAEDYGRHVVPGLDLIESMCASGSNPVATPTVVVRTSVQKELGGYRMGLPHTADMELWLRFASRGPIGFVSADQALKRMHPQNMQRQYLGTASGDIRQRRAAFEEFFERSGGRLEGGDRLWCRARASLALEAFWKAGEAFEHADLPHAEELIAFALDNDPELRSRAEWSRYRWKRRMGPRLWKAVAPLLGWFRCPGRLISLFGPPECPAHPAPGATRP